jgi:hypothetical protein
MYGTSNTAETIWIELTNQVQIKLAHHFLLNAILIQTINTMVSYISTQIRIQCYS